MLLAFPTFQKSEKSQFPLDLQEITTFLTDLHKSKFTRETLFMLGKCLETRELNANK